MKILFVLLPMLTIRSAEAWRNPTFTRSSNNDAMRLRTTTTGFEDSSALNDNVKDPSKHRPASSSPMDNTRRNTLTGTAALLSLSLFKELLDNGDAPLMQPSFTMLDPRVLQGDSIVRNLWLGRLAYPVLVVSLEIGLFEALQRGALSKDALGRKLDPPLQGSGRVLEALIGVLTSLELLRVDANSGAVSLTDAARSVLLQHSPYFWGPQLLAADGMTSSLRKAVHRDDRHVKADYAGHSSASIHSFLETMQAHGAVTAQATAGVLEAILRGKMVDNNKDSLSLPPVKHILDMAGGSGCFAHALYQRGFAVTLADLPPVVDWFRQHARGGVDAVAADLFDASTWPTGPDCHFMANVLHDWGESQTLSILENSFRALTKSKTNNATIGRLVVVEQLLQNDKSGPLPASLASVSMLLGDWRTGKQYSFAELEKLMQQAGFARVELGPKCGEFHTAVIAYTE